MLFVDGRNCPVRSSSLDALPGRKASAVFPYEKIPKRRKAVSGFLSIGGKKCPSSWIQRQAGKLTSRGGGAPYGKTRRAGLKIHPACAPGFCSSRSKSLNIGRGRQPVKKKKPGARLGSRPLPGGTSQQYRCCSLQACTQNQITTQRSGCDLERRSSGVSAL